MPAIRTLIVDDNANIRRRLRGILYVVPEITIVGEAANGQEAVCKARAVEPDLILMDVKMPVMSGLAATRRIKEERPDTKIVVLGLLDYEEYGEEAKRSGASGYLVKMSIPEELVPIIQHVVGNGE